MLRPRYSQCGGLHPTPSIAVLARITVACCADRGGRPQQYFCKRVLLAPLLRVASRYWRDLRVRSAKLSVCFCRHDRRELPPLRPGVFMPEPAKKSMPVPAQRNQNSQVYRSLAELLNETGLSEIEIEENNLRVRVVVTMTMPTHFAPSSYAALATAGVSSRLGAH